MNLINNIKSHYVILVIALAFGLFCSLPQYLIGKNVLNFQGIYHLNVDDYTYYQSRVKDVIDGHTFLSNPYFYEHKDGFPMQTWLTDYIVAMPISWLGLSVPVGFMIWEFFIVTTLLLLTYSILYLLTVSRRWSILGVIFLYLTMFGDFIINIFGYQKKLSMFGDFFLRLPSPALNFVFWLTTILFLLLYVKSKKTVYAVLSSVSFGFLFYVYPYYWTFYVVLLFIFLFLLFIFKQQGLLLKNVIWIILGGIFIGIPYFVATFNSTKIPYHAESLARLGMIQSHFPSGIANVSLASMISLIFIYLLWKKILPLDELNLLLFSGVLTTGVVVNQHTITGKNLEFVNHYFLQNTFWLVFVLMYVLCVLLKNKSRKFEKVLYIFLLFFVIWSSVYSLQTIYSKQNQYKEQHLYAQNYAPVLDWLNNNAGIDDVVFANDDITELVPVYTSQNVFSSPHGILFFLSDEEALNRYIINHYYDTFTTDYIVLNHRKMLGGYYINKYGQKNSVNKVKKILGLKQDENNLVPIEIIEKIKKKSSEMKSVSFEKLVRTYKVDYIVWDKNKNPEWNINKIKTLEKVFSHENIYIYKI